jgi:sec-independent protein translocase protein TatB
MFDIGWSEFVLIAVVALIAIGPKELPGVLRMVGQWMGKARKMAAEFQGQFQEAMREAEMADLKKSFDEVKEAASGFTSGNIMTSLQKDVSSALNIEDIDKPVAPTTPETPTAETFAEADAHVAEASAVETTAAETNLAETNTADTRVAAEPLAITPEVHSAAPPHDLAQAAFEGSSSEGLKDAKAS